MARCANGGSGTVEQVHGADLVSTPLSEDRIGRVAQGVVLGPVEDEGLGQVDLARAQGHEVMLEMPMEPTGYPDNDPGPQTLLTTLTAEQNLDRLYWHLSRFQGYAGIATG